MVNNNGYNSYTDYNGYDSYNNSYDNDYNEGYIYNNSYNSGYGRYNAYQPAAPQKPTSWWDRFSNVFVPSAYAQEVVPNIINSTLPKETYKILHDFLRQEEGLTDYAYLDTQGFPTWGIGHAASAKKEKDRIQEFIRHPWGRIVNDKWIEADKEEKLKFYNDLKNEPYGEKYPASTFKNVSDLRLPAGYAEKLFNEDLTNIIRGLQKNVPYWNKLSPEAKIAAIEVSFNAGIINKENWKNAITAAKNQNINEFCGELHRLEKNKALKRRNKWAYENCINGSFKNTY